MIVFENRELLPEAWRTEGGAGAVRLFNPGLIAEGTGWILAYRVVIEPRSLRRIALCRLNSKFEIVPGSATPFTDAVRFSTPNAYSIQAINWFADPRLYRLGGRLYLYWNSGWHDPQNHQFLQEVHPETLRPVGHPREFVLLGERQKLEKNWVLFEHATGIYAVYTVNPHRILAANLEGPGPVRFADASPPLPNPYGYAQVHGGLRGGAPAVKAGRHFYSFCHSIENDPAGYRYVVAAYRFGAEPPFAPTEMPNAPLAIDVPAEARRRLPKLNPAVGEVLYPAGAALSTEGWVLSLGVDDERCAIAILSRDAVDSTLAPVAKASGS